MVAQRHRKRCKGWSVTKGWSVAKDEVSPDGATKASSVIGSWSVVIGVSPTSGSLWLGAEASQSRAKALQSGAEVSPTSESSRRMNRWWRGEATAVTEGNGKVGFWRRWGDGEECEGFFLCFLLHVPCIWEWVFCDRNGYWSGVALGFFWVCFLGIEIRFISL